LVDRKNYKLLYVEDNLANLRLLERIVRRHTPFVFISASDGRSGADMARNELPDLIVLDIELPVMDGYEVFALLRSSPCTAQIPVIALSASARKEDIEKGLQAGFMRYLTKPVDVLYFIRILDQILDTLP